MSYRVSAYFSASSAYVFDNAKVHEATTDPRGVNLTGRYLAEVPKHRASLQFSFTHPKYLNVSVDTEFLSMQFDDDQNSAKIFPTIADKTFVGLPGYSVTNLAVSRSINHQVDVFFGAQNLFGRLYYVGTNPTTIGTPRLVNGGIRLRIGR